MSEPLTVRRQIPPTFASARGIDTASHGGEVACESDRGEMAKGGWRRNGRKVKRDKQGELSGTGRGRRVVTASSAGHCLTNGPGPSAEYRPSAGNEPSDTGDVG